MTENYEPVDRWGDGKHDPKWGDDVQYLLYQPTFRDGTYFEDPLHPGLLEEKLPLFVDDGRGDLLGILQSQGYFEYLGVGGAGSGPVGEFPEDAKDTIYSQTNPFKISSRAGNEAVLKAINADFPKRGIRVWGDLVFAHTDRRHPLFQRAIRDPDGPEAQMYYLLREDELSRYEQLTSVFIDAHPRPFTKDPVSGRWYIHRFYDDQPALRGDHPAVREMKWDLHRQMLGKWGYQGLRWDACMYEVSPPDSPGEHEEGALETAEVMRARADVEFPGCPLLAEAAGKRQVAAKWIRGKRAHMVWDFSFPAKVFHAVATREWDPLEELFATSPPIDEDARWGLYLRNWDELQLAYEDEAEQELLFATLGVNGRYRTHRGLKQRLGDLVPHDDLLVSLQGLTVCADGVPFINAGDEVAARGRRDAFERWASRQSCAWDDRQPNAGFSRARELAFPLSPDWRERNVRRQMGDPGSVLERIRRLIYWRKRLVALQRGVWASVERSAPEVLCFARVHDGETRSNAPAQDAIVAINIAPYPVRPQLTLDRWRSSRLVECFVDPRHDTGGRSEKEIPWVGWEKYALPLAPYEMRLIRPLTPYGRPVTG